MGTILRSCHSSAAAQQVTVVQISPGQLHGKKKNFFFLCLLIRFSLWWMETSYESTQIVYPTFGCTVTRLILSYRNSLFSWILFDYYRIVGIQFLCWLLNAQILEYFRLFKILCIQKDPEDGCSWSALETGMCAPLASPCTLCAFLTVRLLASLFDSRRLAVVFAAWWSPVCFCKKPFAKRFLDISAWIASLWQL